MKVQGRKKQAFIVCLLTLILVVTLTSFFKFKGSAQSSNILELESAVLSGEVSIKEDTLASGGKYVQFGSTASTSPTPVAGKKFYVDCTNGIDTNAGTGETSAWKSISKANNATLSPGDGLFFKKGCTWTGPLTAKWKGTADKNIVISAYGTGELPRIQNTPTNSNVSITGAFQTIENIYTRSDSPSISNTCKLPNSTAGQKVGYKLGFRFET